MVDFEAIIDRVRRRQSFTPMYRTVTLDLGTATVEDVQTFAGSYIQIIDATDTVASIRVRFNENQNDPITLRKGDAVITPFYRFFLSWDAQAGKTVTLAVSPSYDLWRIDRSAQIISTIDSITNPVTITGTAVVKEFLLDRAQAGAIYEAGGSQVGVGGQLSHMQVFNPAASGKTVVVLNLQVAHAAVATAGIQLMQYNTALLTDVGAFVNVQSGGAAGAAHLRKEANATGLGTNELMNTIIPVGAPVDFPRCDVLGPGEGLHVLLGTAATTLYASFRIWEF